MADFDWTLWAANFPLSWTLAEAMPQAGLPETIVISRAGKQIALTREEFAEVARGLAGHLAPTEAPAQHAIAKSADD